MGANCSLPPAKPNCEFHKKKRAHSKQTTSRAHSANSKSMLSSLTMSASTIKEIDFEVSQPWDNGEGDTWDTEEGTSGNRFPKKKKSLPAARPKTRHRSVGTTMAPPAEEHVLVGKGGRVRRTKVRQQHWEGGGGPGPNARGRGGRNFSNRSRG